MSNETRRPVAPRARRVVVKDTSASMALDRLLHPGALEDLRVDLVRRDLGELLGSQKRSQRFARTRPDGVERSARGDRLFPGAGGNGGAGTAPNGVDGSSAGAILGGGACGPIFLNVPPGAAAPTAGAASPGIRTSTTCVTQGGMAPTCTYP
jgi:hypothetical protein